MGISLDKEQILLARQPIYDKNKAIQGYELLFRSNEGINPEEMDGNVATSQVLLNAFTESDIASITSNTLAFVNFTRELIARPPPFSTHNMVIEILENIPVDEALISDVIKLKAKGFQIALDDFVMDEKYLPLLPYIDIIKLELPAMSDTELTNTIAFLGHYSHKLLAEKVETHQEFHRCKQLGCDLFQGYFLSKPEIIKGKTITQNKLTILKLIGEVQNPEIKIPNLIKVINQDPSLSYSLLKLINSAAYQRPKNIDSIHTAVMLLGMNKIKSWSCLLALGKLDDKPEAIKEQALLRARMCEFMAKNIEPDQSDSYFMVGLLSCLGLFFDSSLKEILKQIPLSPLISEALLDNKGKAGLAIHTVLSYERNHWNQIHWNLLQRFDVTKKTMNEYFLSAIKWVQSHSKE